MGLCQEGATASAGLLVWYSPSDLQVRQMPRKGAVDAGCCDVALESISAKMFRSGGRPHVCYRSLEAVRLLKMLQETGCSTQQMACGRRLGSMETFLD